MVTKLDSISKKNFRVTFSKKIQKIETFKSKQNYINIQKAEQRFKLMGQQNKLGD